MQRERGLLEIFRSLPSPRRRASKSEFSGISIAPSSALYLAKDSEGRPSFLLPGHARVPPVRLENLEVRHRVRCRIIANKRSIDIESATLIGCLSTDKDLQKYFVEVLGAVLQRFSAGSDASRLGDLVEALSELFQAASSEPASTAQGLWAELMLIDASTNPRVMINAWHSEVDDLFDFSASAERIEVKSSSDKTRCHNFRYEQVESIPGLHVLIASVLVDRSARGKSLGDLWDRCREHVDALPAQQLKVDSICFRSLGKHWRQWRDVSFDYHRATASLAFFNAESIPKPVAPIPTGVSEVRFVSDLSLVKPIERMDVHAIESLFAACAGLLSSSGGC